MNPDAYSNCTAIFDVSGIEQSALLEECGEAFVAATVESGRALRETRQAAVAAKFQPVTQISSSR